MKHTSHVFDGVHVHVAAKVSEESSPSQLSVSSDLHRSWIRASEVGSPIQLAHGGVLYRGFARHQYCHDHDVDSDRLRNHTPFAGYYYAHSFLIDGVRRSQRFLHPSLRYSTCVFLLDLKIFISNQLENSSIPSATLDFLYLLTLLSMKTLC
jgi:hypothetical protein